MNALFVIFAAIFLIAFGVFGVTLVLSHVALSAGLGFQAVTLVASGLFAAGSLVGIQAVDMLS